MILTVTLNPSVDIAYQLDDFRLDSSNRAGTTHKTAGGKGLNVTRVLHQLGERVSASGLLGGKLGEAVEEDLDQAGISHSFCRIAGDTRNCIAVLHSGRQTEILEGGPVISEEEAAAFLEHFESCLPEAAAVVLSGSLPQGLPADYYVQLLELCRKHQTPVLLDCSGPALEAVLKSSSRPTLIKPNQEELTALLQRPVGLDDAELKAALSQEIFAGIDWVIVSLGAQGAFAKHGEDFYRVSLPDITVVNPVGSGDSSVAGLASALVHQLSDQDLLRRANTLGMLNAREALTGFVNLADYDQLFHQIHIRKV